MSHINEANQSKESEKNINLSSNNIDECFASDEKNNDNLKKAEESGKNKDFQNIINEQETLNFIDKRNQEIIENQNNINNMKNMNNNNFTEEEEENNNIINNNFEDELDDNEEMNLEQENINNFKNENYDNNNDDEELPLITLNFISICQCCKNSFDNKTYLPYLLKCGHFFCIKCINDYFTDKIGIKCPSDGLIAKSINELTLLSNLIPKNNPTDNNNNININLDSKDKENIKNNQNQEKNAQINNNISNNSNYCPIHREQKLSHVICDTNEIICVYCAFEKFKNNPKCEIKELSTQLNDFSSNINKIISDNQNEVLYLHDSLKKIKTNKENEEKAINTFFECLFDYLNEKKNDYLEQINNLFSNNAKKLGDKLEEVTQNIENSEKLKKKIDNFVENGGKQENNFKENYNNIINKYLMLKQKNKINKQRIELDEYKFIHIDEDKLVKKCQDLGEIKINVAKNKYNLNHAINYNFNKGNNFNKIIINKNNDYDLKLLSSASEKEYIIKNNKINDFQKEEILAKKDDNKTIDSKQSKNENEPQNNKFKNMNYIILDDLSINNNNSYINNDKNIIFENNNENDNNYYINEYNNNSKKNKDNSYNIFNKRSNHSILRKNSFSGINSKGKKVIIHKNTKSLYNYIDFPNYNTNYNNYYLLSKINNKKDKERNITVNNYEVHQLLKNSFNNNYNYGHNYNNPIYSNKFFEFNTNYNGYNTNTNNNIQMNRKKITFLDGLSNGGNNNNKKFQFK